MSAVTEPVVVGGYRLGRRLDVAGSAETYQATGPGGEVAILKVLRDVSQELAAGMSTRLEVAAGHPGLIIPSAWGRDGDDFYVVRDYIPGIDLESMIQAGGPLEPSLAVRYVVQAASAAAAIESQGLSLGHLKTSNDRERPGDPPVRRLRAGGDPVRAGDRSGPLRRLLGLRGGTEAPHRVAHASESAPGRRARVDRQGANPPSRARHSPPCQL